MPDKIPCMKARNVSEERLQEFSFPAVSQMKADGMRCQMEVTSEKVTPLSSIGRVYHGLSKYLENDLNRIKNNPVLSLSQLPKAFILDGELLAHDPEGNPLPRAKSNGITNKLGHGTITTKEMASLRFIVWDYIPSFHFWEGYYPFPYSDRLNLVTRLVKDCSAIWVIPTKIVNDAKEAKEHALELIREGYEGTIIKDSSSPWENRRSKYALKFKEENDCDLKVVEIQEGTGKYVGMMGALLCESGDQKVKVKIGTGFTDAMRYDFFEEENILGKIVKVKYNTKTDPQNGIHSLFLPKFGGLRTDKTTPDSLDQIN